MKPILLVPMAGKGQRFIDDGFDTPKQLINVGKKLMIDWSFDSIEWRDCKIIFIVRSEQIVNNKLESVLKERFGDDITIIPVNYNTEGTVASCLLAREYIDNESPLFITTLDVYFRPHFNPNMIDVNLFDGCILTFKANNPAYSYSEVDENGIVLKTAEKEVISNKASVGLYCFSKGKDFVKYGDMMIENNIRTRGEFYVCPLYNLLIEDGLKINTLEIDEMYHMGTPSELDEFNKKYRIRLENEI
jgi:dTDP-glucose pyrophosphorylase